MRALRPYLSAELRHLFEGGVGRRGCSPNAIGRVSDWGLQHGVLQGPGRSSVLVVSPHVEIDGVDLFIFEDAEVGKSAAAAGGGSDRHGVRGLAARGGTAIQARGITVSVAPAADAHAGATTASVGAS